MSWTERSIPTNDYFRYFNKGFSDAFEGKEPRELGAFVSASAYVAYREGYDTAKLQEKERAQEAADELTALTQEFGLYAK